MGTILNFIIGFLITGVTVLAVIWVYQRFLGGDISKVGTGSGLGLGLKSAAPSGASI